MANRRPQAGGRRMDFSRNDRPKSFSRPGVSPWQGGVPGAGISNLLPLGGTSAEATLALANNLINLLQPRQTSVPSLLDMPIRRDFGPEMSRFDRSFTGNRMGNQGNYRRSGSFVRSGDRGGNRKPYKSNDQKQQSNRSSQKIEADSKPKPVKESEQDAKDSSTSDKVEEKKEPGGTQYDDIDSQLLKCHICNKSMWDGRSFENHLSGRAHNIMMQKVAESYALTADTMRQEIKIQEMKRNRKSGGHQQQSCDFFCTMCDMYAADGAVHRTTVGHRKLKKYLHPACVVCHKEMPNRLELDVHRLTAEHMRNTQNRQDDTKRPEVFVVSTLEMEQRYVHQDKKYWRRYSDVKDKDDKGKDKTKDGENQAEVSIKKEPMETGEQPAEEKKNEPLDKENTILDFKEGDDVTSATRDMFPVYSTERGVGKSFLAELRCIQCKLCHKLLDCEETAEMHLRTRKHHQLFVRLLGEKSNQRKFQEAGKRPIKSEESGNWKRRKTSPERDDDGDSQDVDQHNGHEDDTMENIEKVENQNDDAADVDMPAEDSMEEWEQSVDEILQDEAKHGSLDGETQNDEDNEQEENENGQSEKNNSEAAKSPERKTLRSSQRARRGRY